MQAVDKKAPQRVPTSRPAPIDHGRWRQGAAWRNCIAGYSHRSMLFQISVLPAWLETWIDCKSEVKLILLFIKLTVLNGSEYKLLSLTPCMVAPMKGSSVPKLSLRCYSVSWWTKIGDCQWCIFEALHCVPLSRSLFKIIFVIDIFRYLLLL